MTTKECSICGGTGRYPLVKNGKVIPDALIFCPDCYEEGNPYPYQLKPSDFGYAMSDAHYRSLCQLHGWPMPPVDRHYAPESQLEETIVHHQVIYDHSDMTPLNLKRLDRIEFDVVAIKGKRRQTQTQSVKDATDSEDSDRVDVTQRYGKR